MSRRITISIPDKHYNWLDKVKINRGWDSVQGAIRSLIEDAYRLDEKINAGIVDESASLKVSGVSKEKSAIQMS